MSLVIVLYLIHKNSVARNAPDIFIARKISWPTQACKKGLISVACPFVTRNWVINPSATMRPNSVYSMNLMVRLSTLKRLGTFNTSIYLNICRIKALASDYQLHNVYRFSIQVVFRPAKSFACNGLNTIRTQLIPNLQPHPYQLSPNFPTIV